MRLLLLLLPIFTFAQFQADYSYSNINIYDDFYNEQLQDAVIVGKSYNDIYYTPYYGKVKSSFKSSSDSNALIDYQYNSDYIYRYNYSLDPKIGEAIVKGNNNTYYVVELYKN
tara:strand:+ start:460 stop:798 length:339 start_codon:yes stop_codon:yes gene_type:complete